LLVFEHDADYQAGIQVPGGGIEPGESPEAAAIRESLEETGLSLQNPVFLGSKHYAFETGNHHWHFFWLQAPESTPDAWEHFAENQYVFYHRFADPKTTELYWPMGDFLPQLEEHL
jgi:8-oxo-dGTP pyrophosphatase MutT (NUDIX family)